MNKDINLTCCINTLGYGVTGENVALALKKLGQRVSLWPIGGHVECNEKHVHEIKEMISNKHSYNKNVDSLRIFHQFDLAQHVGKGNHVGMPIFELDKFHKHELNHLNNQDALIVNSNWAIEVLRNNNVNVPIFLAPLGVDRSIFNEVKISKEKEETVFFNFGKWEYRKGHDFIVKAFNMAFEKEDNVFLVMNCYNPCVSNPSYNDEWEKLYKNSKLGEKIHIFKSRMPSQSAVAEIIEKCDCGIFPSRAEGWNLDALESLSMGKHIIITNYSGHTEFVNHTNSLLIDIDSKEDAHDGVWFHADKWEDGVPGKWAELGEKQLEQTILHMRMIHALKKNKILETNYNGIETANVFSWENTAKHIMSALEALYEP